MINRKYLKSKINKTKNSSTRIIDRNLWRARKKLIGFSNRTLNYWQYEYLFNRMEIEKWATLGYVRVDEEIDKLWGILRIWIERESEIRIVDTGISTWVILSEDGKDMDRK